MKIECTEYEKQLIITALNNIGWHRMNVSSDECDSYSSCRECVEHSIEWSIKENNDGQINERVLEKILTHGKCVDKISTVQEIVMMKVDA